MADILTLVFRTFIAREGLTKDFKEISPSQTSCSSLVVGDRSASRSLLLLAAVTAASEFGIQVVFFTQTQIQSLPAFLHNRMPNISPDHLKKIRFSYPSTVGQLLQQVACLHESASLPSLPPSLIIVDRLEGYLHNAGGSSHSRLQQGEQSVAAHVSALLYDTAAFFTKVLEKRGSSLSPCRVIASYHSEWEARQAGGEPSAPDPVLAVLDRYFQVRCTLDRDRSYGPVAAGLQEAWRVYLSGRGATEAAGGPQDKDWSVGLEWRWGIFPDGSMEFTLV